MITNDGRFDVLKRSLKCFLDQTYSNKELLIVTDGSENFKNDIKSLVHGLKNVDTLFLKNKYPLGTLRNISIGVADGDLLVQWDDDDFNSPERLILQYRYLILNPRAIICYLSDQLHYYFNTNILYWEDWKNYCSGQILKYSLIPGTGMFWKMRNIARYPSSGFFSSIGEDTEFAKKVCEDPKNVILLGGIGYTNIYSFHGGNVWDEQHHLDISSKRAVDRKTIIKNEYKIKSIIDYHQFQGVVKVMSRDGLVFEYASK